MNLKKRIALLSATISLTTVAIPSIIFLSNTNNINNLVNDINEKNKNRNSTLLFSR